MIPLRHEGAEGGEGAVPQALRSNCQKEIYMTLPRGWLEMIPFTPFSPFGARSPSCGKPAAELSRLANRSISGHGRKVDALSAARPAVLILSLNRFSRALCSARPMRAHSLAAEGHDR